MQLDDGTEMISGVRNGRLINHTIRVEFQCREGSQGILSILQNPAEKQEI